MSDSVGLTTAEAGRLAELETIISQGLQIFIAVGNALTEIRDSRLYRVNYPTFEEYCLRRWGLRRAHAYRQMDAAKVISNLSPIGDIVPLPINEAQTRPLAKLSAEQQRQVWTVAVETAPAGHITAAHVERTARRLIQVFEQPEPEEFICPRCGQRTAQVNEGVMCLSEACGAVWGSQAEYEAELDGYTATQPVEFPKVLLLDRQRRDRLRAYFAEVVNYLPAEDYAFFVERLEALLAEFNLLHRVG